VTYEVEVRPRDDGLIELVFVRHGLRHVALFTADELTRAENVLAELPPDGTPADLSAAYRAAIGRDPFDPGTAPAPDEAPWWREVLAGALLVLSGAGFGAQDSPLWVRLLGWTAAAVGLVVVAGGVRRRLRARPVADKS
jgi:hypothetical protein